MQKKSVVVMAALWCFTILLALGVGAGAGWHLALTTVSKTAAAVPVKSAPAADPAPEKTTAQAANDASLPPEGKPVSDENDRLRVAFRQALKEVVDRSGKQPGAAPAPPRIQSLWDRAYARWKQRRDSGMFGRLDENMNLMADMSRTGAPGMKFWPRWWGTASGPWRSANSRSACCRTSRTGRRWQPYLS